MKKIMFNDRYGLTEAVLQGSKTVTRRLINKLPNNYTNEKYMNYCLSLKKQPYEVGEIVAVAQSYESVYSVKELRKLGFLHKKIAKNKTQVKSSLMPHQIRIVNVRAERLQDITDEDCLREGIETNGIGYHFRDYNFNTPKGRLCAGLDPIKIFASLIDKISGKGTWESNPFVWRIEFELIK